MCIIVDLFYDWKHHIKPFGLGGAVKPMKKKGDGQTDQIDLRRALFVEQPHGCARSVNYCIYRSSIELSKAKYSELLYSRELCYTEYYCRVK